MEERKRGRPSKGPRKSINVFLPLDLSEALQETAARDGMTMTDVVGEAIAERVGTPYAPAGYQPHLAS
jgi:hypothetical protein